MFLEISENSQENSCARASFLIKFQASGFVDFLENMYSVSDKLILFWIHFFLIVEVFFLHILYEFHEIKLNVMKYIKMYFVK